MEELKKALEMECNSNFAICTDCEVRVWKTTFPNKVHACHGNTYDLLFKHYDAEHKKLITEQIKEIADAHNRYAASTNPSSASGGTPSGGGGGASSTPSSKVEAAVNTLFNSTVYPTYHRDKKPFDDAKGDIGGIDNEECIQKYNAAYLAMDNHPDVLALSDEKAKKDELKKLHTSMNARIRAKDGDSSAMVEALKEVFA